MKEYNDAKLIYRTEDYQEPGLLFGDDEDIISESITIVKTRKTHLCPQCQREYPTGTIMLLDSAIYVGEGRKSCHVCLDCANSILKDIGCDCLVDDNGNRKQCPDCGEGMFYDSSCGKNIWECISCKKEIVVEDLNAEIDYQNNEEQEGGEK